jgi:hypothetical protein
VYLQIDPNNPPAKLYGKSYALVIEIGEYAVDGAPSITQSPMQRRWLKYSVLRDLRCIWNEI